MLFDNFGYFSEIKFLSMGCVSDVVLSLPFRMGKYYSETKKVRRLKSLTFSIEYISHKLLA